MIDANDLSRLVEASIKNGDDSLIPYCEMSVAAGFNGFFATFQKFDTFLSVQQLKAGESTRDPGKSNGFRPVNATEFRGYPPRALSLIAAEAITEENSGQQYACAVLAKIPPEWDNPRNEAIDFNALPWITTDPRGMGGNPGYASSA